MTTTALETFRSRYGPWAIVAGGSDGTGASFARELAQLMSQGAAAMLPTPRS